MLIRSTLHSQHDNCDLSRKFDEIVPGKTKYRDSAPTARGETPGPADPASGRAAPLGGDKIGLKYRRFFANLTKVLAKICVLL